MRHSMGLLAVVSLAACAPEPESPTAESPPPAPQQQPAAAAPATPAAGGDVITAERGGFIPEGIEYDEDNGRFLTGSLAEGTIFVIERDGRVVPFIQDAELVSTVGIEADEDRDRLLVTNSNSAVFADQNASGHAKLGVYHLTTGERLAMVDLGATIAAPAGRPATAPASRATTTAVSSTTESAASSRTAGRRVAQAAETTAVRKKTAAVAPRARWVAVMPHPYPPGSIRPQQDSR